MTTPDLEFIRQQHEAWLNDLEGYAVQALASGDWSEVYAHLAAIALRKTNLCECFDSKEEYNEVITFIDRILGDRASTKVLSRPGADSFSQPTNKQSIRINTDHGTTNTAGTR